MGSGMILGTTLSAKIYKEKENMSEISQGRKGPLLWAAMPVTIHVEPLALGCGTFLCFQGTATHFTLLSSAGPCPHQGFYLCPVQCGKVDSRLPTKSQRCRPI